MLDTHARGTFDGLIGRVARGFIKMGWPPTRVTYLALAVGLAASVTFVFGYEVLAVSFLWLSGLFDAVDGSIARATGTMSKRGTFLDIVFDRIVEIGFVLSLAIVHPEARLGLLVLSCTFFLSITMFLVMGALVENDGPKTFKYQAGLVERTECFILFSLMMLFGAYIIPILLVFILMMIITLVQRFTETLGFLKDN